MRAWSELWLPLLSEGSPELVKKPPLRILFSLEIAADSHNHLHTDTRTSTTMNYPHTATTDPYTLSLWPDASASGEEDTTASTQVAGYSQPGFTFDGFSFDSLDATAAWGQCATLPSPTYGLPNTSVSTPALAICVELTFVLGYRLDLRRYGPSRGLARP